MDKKTDKILVDRSRQMRKNPTEEENKLWYILLKHIKPRFTRQRIFGNYIVDFFCPKLKLIIEVDGEQHYLDKTNDFWKKDSLSKRQEKDKAKNDYCNLHQIKLIRIPYWEKNNITLEMILGDQYLI